MVFLVNGWHKLEYIKIKNMHTLIFVLEFSRVCFAVDLFAVASRWKIWAADSFQVCTVY